MGTKIKSKQFGVSIDVTPLNKLAKELKGFEKEIPGAVSSALNRTIQHVYTKVGSIVVENYAVKSSDVKATMKSNVSKATKGKLSASILSRGHTLSFAHFPYSPKKPGTGRYVKVKIKKQSGYKEVKTPNRPFVAPTGARSEDKIQFNVFIREGKARKPIMPLRTLSIPQMITNKTTEEKITEVANNKLAERVDHEIKYRLDKIQREMKI
jgi:hypothetical protein